MNHCWCGPSVSQGNPIYLQDPNGELVPFPMELLPYSRRLTAEQQLGRGANEGIPVITSCSLQVLASLIGDLQDAAYGQNIDVAKYDVGTLTSLLLCARELGIDVLTQAYRASLGGRMGLGNQYF